MKIKIKDETQTLVLSDEELDNYNFVDLGLYDTEAKSEDNPRGLVSECTMPIDELKAAVDAFYQLKKEKRLNKSIEKVAVYDYENRKNMGNAE